MTGNRIRISHLDDDDPEREFWPIERSRLLPQLEAGVPVLVKRTHAVIVGGWPEPSMSGATGRAELEGIGFFDGPKLSVRDGSLSITGWVVRADDTVTASYAEPLGPQRFWELDSLARADWIFGPAPGIPVSTSTALSPLTRNAFDMPRPTTDIGVTVVRVINLTVRMPWGV